MGWDLQFDTILVGGILHAWTKLIIITGAPTGPGIPLPSKRIHARTLWGERGSCFKCVLALEAIDARPGKCGLGIQGSFRPAMREFWTLDDNKKTTPPFQATCFLTALRTPGWARTDNSATAH